MSIQSREQAIDIVQILNGTVSTLYADKQISESAKETLLLTGVFMLQEMDKLLGKVQP